MGNVPRLLQLRPRHEWISRGWLGCLCLLMGASVAIGQTPIKISIPGGAPLVLSSSGTTPVQVIVSPGTDTVVPDSVKLFHRVSPAAFQEIAMTPAGGNAYQGELPASLCDVFVQWYVSAEGVTTGVIAEPPGGEGAPFEAAVGTTAPVISYNFQTAPGWTVNGNASAGSWALGVPVGCNRGDPPADYDGSGSCFLTQPSVVVSPPTCDTDVDGGITRLLSPVFQLGALADPHVRYARWYSNSSVSGIRDDAMEVEISGDSGTNWSPVETVGPQADGPRPEVNGGWYPRMFRIADFSLNGTAVRLRFTVYDQGVSSTVEAGIDAFSIVDLDCVQPTCIRGDLTGDTTIDGRDVGRFVQVLVQGGATVMETCAGDLESTPDGAVGISDISAFVSCLLAGGCT